MRNFFNFLLLLGGLVSLYACEEEAKNPGDYNLKSELKVVDVSTKNRVDVSLNILRSIDSTYVRFYERNDTMKNNGVPVVDENGKYIITKDTVYYNSRITAKFIELEKIILPSPVDTIYISLESNSKWIAPMPSANGEVQWFFTQRLAGGGDGTVIAAVTRCKYYTRVAEQYILTPDSTVMYKLTFEQKSALDE